MARDLQPALVAIGQVAGGIVGAVGQVDLVEPVLAFSIASLAGLVAADAEYAEEGEARGRISGLCWATSRFSSTVMPPKRRMFWKVRATLAFQEMRKSSMRSSRSSCRLRG
jgi:hypothetical protein